MLNRSRILHVHHLGHSPSHSRSFRLPMVLLVCLSNPPHSNQITHNLDDEQPPPPQYELELALANEQDVPEEYADAAANMDPGNDKKSKFMN
jgi:hypothetical protein